MKNGWTGGQYSLYRAVFAIYLLAHFLPFLPWGRKVFFNEYVPPHNAASSLLDVYPNVPVLSTSPATVAVLLAAGAVLSVFFGMGLYDRAAALGLWYIWACLFSRDALVANPSIPFVGWLLLAHVFLPPAPYGSWAARGRIDPGGGWRMPPAVFAAAWIVLAIGYTYSGYTKLVNFTPLGLPSRLLRLGAWTVLALDLAFAPLALLPRLRPCLWGMMLMMHLSLILPIDFADVSLGMVMFHLFAWDPGWIRPVPGGTERVFYDGHCGLCQRSVRLILAEDATGAAFRFAPLQGETFAALLTETERAALPLSLVVRTEKGTLLTRSAGVLHILRRLGGVWRLLAGVLVLLPPALRDRLYDGVAHVRLHLFARPAELCPLMPPSLRARFDP